MRTALNVRNDQAEKLHEVGSTGGFKVGFKIGLRSELGVVLLIGACWCVSAFCLGTHTYQLEIHEEVTP